MKKIFLSFTISALLVSCQDTCPTDDLGELTNCLCDFGKEQTEAVESQDQSAIDDVTRRMEIMDEEIAIEIDKGTYSVEELQEALQGMDCE